jgi:hypothetical protein
MSSPRSKKSRSAEVASQWAQLRQDYESLKAQIQTLGYILPGTVQTRRYRCGKPTCRCMTQGLLHGPYEQWTRKIGGKTVNLNLDPASAPTVREWIQNNRRLRQLCRQLEQTSLKALDTRTNLDKDEPPP